MPSRIGSTWGGGLVDMVRSRRIMEIIERDGVFDHAARVGKWFLAQLQNLGDRHPDTMSNVRGRGLMCAFDLPDPPIRDAAIAALHDESTSSCSPAAGARYGSAHALQYHRR